MSAVTRSLLSARAWGTQNSAARGFLRPLSSSPRVNNKSLEESPPVKGRESSAIGGGTSEPMEPVTDLRRRILFKFALPGRYASPADVPNQVSYSEMTRAQGRLRVYAANVFIGLTLVGCVVAIYIGKTTPKDQYIVALREKKAKAQREEWLAEQEAAKNKKD